MNTEQERADFEAWYRHHHGDRDVYALDESGEYADKQVQGAFNAWQAAIEADRKRRGEPAFYVNARIFDPATGKIKTDVNGALTWSEKPAGNWQVPVYTAPQSAESEKTDGTCQECGGDGAGGDHEDDCSHGEPVGYFLNVNPGDERPRWEQVSDEYKNDHDIVALYTTPQPQQIPEGYKMVPIEPTDDMIDAAYEVDIAWAGNVYKAMLEAAPEVKP